MRKLLADCKTSNASFGLAALICVFWVGLCLADLLYDSRRKFVLQKAENVVYSNTRG